MFVTQNVPLCLRCRIAVWLPELRAGGAISRVAP
ncbi:hypothetical protein SAMN07250955_10844 [Arboricoccus pini]|uniref:Uncharacterized protein n=1 Tax=Arboricoccus pini TaxID=1963835 RepID=A0A212RFR9_9PROT|nr:hypothetical protein SAMN07250955_10844 [Arboricoccus pini]